MAAAYVELRKTAPLCAMAGAALVRFVLVEGDEPNFFVADALGVFG